MRKTTNKKFFGVTLIAIFTLAIASCKKEQKDDLTTPNDAETKSLLQEAIIPVFFTCTSNIPDSLKVPEGNKLLLQTYAKGVQIWQVQRSKVDPNTFLWVNVAPSAKLYARPDFTNELAIHYGGPTWEFTKGPAKGEKVVGKKLKGVTVDATAVPWLLLGAVDSLSSAGNKVTFIQRICTTGGIAPSTIPDEAHLNELDSIPYTASYLFYVKE